MPVKTEQEEHSVYMGAETHDIFAGTPVPKESAQQPEAKPDKEPEKPKELTDDEKQQLSDQVVESLGYGKPKAKEEAKPDKKDEKPDKPDKAKDEKADKKEPEKKDEKTEKTDKTDDKKKTTVSRKPTPAPPVDTSKLVREVAVETGKAVAKELATVRTDAVAPQLAQHEKRDVEIARTLEKLNPDKYTGLSGKVEKFFGEVLKPYREKWLAANPGETFDPDDEAHAKVYEKQPDIDPDDYSEAQVEMRAEAKVSEKFDKLVKPKLAELDRQSVERDLVPKLHQSAAKQSVDLLKTATPEFEKYLKEDKPMDKIADDDPQAAGILSQSIQFVSAAAHEFEKLMAEKLQYDFNPEKNSIHADIARHILDYESRLLQKPEEELQWQGRQFATVEQWDKMSAEQKKQHWIVSWPEIRDDYFTVFNSQVKETIAKQREISEKSLAKRGWSKNEASETTPKPEDKPKPEAKAEPIEDRPKPTPAPPAGGGDKVITQDTTTPQTKNFADQVLTSLFS